MEAIPSFVKQHLANDGDGKNFYINLTKLCLQTFDTLCSIRLKTTRDSKNVYIKYLVLESGGGNHLNDLFYQEVSACDLRTEVTQHIMCIIQTGATQQNSETYAKDLERIDVLFDTYCDASTKGITHVLSGRLKRELFC